ncbi:hypothetical protein ACIPF8_03615 [Collimonas sp. NPDC087041]|uniref:hypothetical protein n=1 Tax=Collimonas sp. NPDC087041 TaxID=3363960 RepID=UPI003826CE0C
MITSADALDLKVTNIKPQDIVFDKKDIVQNTSLSGGLPPLSPLVTVLAAAILSRLKCGRNDNVFRC